MADARPFGVVCGAGAEARVAFFRKSTLGGFAWQAHFTDREAARALRFGARCEGRDCGHFDGAGRRCALGERLHLETQPVVDQLPSCLIRSGCRWFAERGAGICLRCPQVLGALALPLEAGRRAQDAAVQNCR